MDLFVIEVRGKAVAVINADDRLHAEAFAASLDARRHQMKDCVPFVSVGNPSRAQSAIWRAAWMSELRAGSVEPDDVFCVWLRPNEPDDQGEAEHGLGIGQSF